MKWKLQRGLIPSQILLAEAEEDTDLLITLDNEEQEATEDGEEEEGEREETSNLEGAQEGDFLNEEEDEANPNSTFDY